MEVTGKYKGNYRMDVSKKSGKKVACKLSYIPVQLREFPEKDLILVAVYGFGKEPMLLLTNLTFQEKKKLCLTVAKIYLMRWRIEEYFKFKKQQFELEDFHVITIYLKFKFFCNLSNRISWIYGFRKRWKYFYVKLTGMF